MPSQERNLEADPRATLLVEHWDRSDWSRLWWVRAELRWQSAAEAGRAAALAAGLAEVLKYGLIGDPAFFEWIEHNLDRLLAKRD